MKPGRPEKPVHHRRINITGVRLTVAQRQRIQIAARRCNQSLSTWVRDALMLAVNMSLEP